MKSEFSKLSSSNTRWLRILETQLEGGYTTESHFWPLLSFEAVQRYCEPGEVNILLKSVPGMRMNYFHVTADNIEHFDLKFALTLEHTGSLRKVITADGRDMTSTEAIQLVESLGFGFSDMLRDQHASRLGIQELCKLHRLGHKLVRKILGESGAIIGKRNYRASVTDDMVREAFKECGGNYTLMGKRLGMHRVSVSKRVKKLGLC